MKKYTSYEIAQLMCELYVDYYNERGKHINALTEIEIKQRMKELSDKTNKTLEHLNDCLAIYFESFTDERQKIIKEIKNEIKQNKKNPILERLRDLSENDLKKYLETTSASAIKSKLKEIINGNDKEKADQARVVFELVDKIQKQTKQQKNKDHGYKRYLQIKETFDKMVNNGYFLIGHFCKDFHGEYSLDYDTFRSIVHGYMSELKRNHGEDYNKYQYLMKQNLLISYEKNRYQIERIISLQEKYDIIDYYMYINLPPKTFLYMCECMLTDEEYMKVKRFIRKNFEIPSYNPKNNAWIIVPFEMIKGEIVTQETQEMILKFMKENNIPSNFFIACLIKYRNNELNIEKTTVKSLK